MLELTKKEKEIFKKQRKSFAKEPLKGIEEGLVQSYYDAEAYKEYEEVSYECAKRLLIEVAQKRGLSANNEKTFEIEDMVKKNKLDDLNLDFYNNYESLKKYIEDKTKDMSAEEVEQFYYKIGDRTGIQAQFTEFMTNYIPKIIDNLYKLSYEIREEEKSDESFSMFEEPTDEDWGMDDDELEVISGDDSIEWSGNDDDWISEDPYKLKDDKLSDEDLIECIKFLNTYSKLMTYKGNGQKIIDELSEIEKSKELSEFYDKKEFFEDFMKIMEHDKTKHNYLFHGTQDLESAQSIIDEGLGMMREDLSSTTYAEFSMDEVILYSRGFANEIGKDAIVIIDQPINEDGKREEIVQRLDKNKEISFIQSGLQGLDEKPQYIIDSKYIIGYVNKRDKEVNFNPKYYEYEKYKTEKGSTQILPEQIGKATIGTKTENKDKAKNQIKQDLQKLHEKEKNK